MPGLTTGPGSRGIMRIPWTRSGGGNRHTKPGYLSIRNQSSAGNVPSLLQPEDSTMMRHPDSTRCAAAGRLRCIYPLMNKLVKLIVSYRFARGIRASCRAARGKRAALLLSPARQAFTRNIPCEH